MAARPFGNAHFGTIFDVLTRSRSADERLAEADALDQGWVAVSV